MKIILIKIILIKIILMEIILIKIIFIEIIITKIILIEIILINRILIEMILIDIILIIIQLGGEYKAWLVILEFAQRLRNCSKQSEPPHCSIIITIIMIKQSYHRHPHSHNQYHHHCHFDPHLHNQRQSATQQIKWGSYDPSDRMNNYKAGIYDVSKSTHPEVKKGSSILDMDNNNNSELSSKFSFPHHHCDHLGISGYDGSMVPEGNIEAAPDMNSSYWAKSPQRLKGQLTSKLHQVNRLILNIHKFNICNTAQLS